MGSFCPAIVRERSLAMADAGVATSSKARERGRLQDIPTRGELILTLTENANTIVKTLTDQAPETEAGLRIRSSNVDNTAFAAAVASSPEPADQVVETGGTRLFLEPGAAVALDDKVLDATVDDHGAVSFAIGALA